ncbi:radical SAM protein [Geovibrio sp. ADMFC3]
MPMPRHTEPLYRPPSEADSLIFQITEGCSYNKCAFCGMYIDKPFRIKPLNDILVEINGIPEHYAIRVHRVFLADGDGVIYPTDDLAIILDAIRFKFPALRRISSYAGPQALMKKSAGEWRLLREKGLKLLYFGLESGNNEVLALMNKGMKADKILPKVQEIRAQGIDFSVMVILGGGGRKLSHAHMQDSTAWLNATKPKYVSLLTLFLRRKRDYFDSIEKPCIGDLTDEIRRFLTGMNEGNMIFRSNHVSNFVPLEGVLPKDKEKLLKKVNEAEQILASRGMLEQYPDFYEEF